MGRETTSTSRSINVALFGDLHGRVLLPFYLCGRWEQEHGEPIHAALCTGDVGIYRCFEAMERTSQRWARRHPEELGFSKFFFRRDPHGRCLVRHPVADEVLAQTRAQLYFVPGNHEEHRYLELLWTRYARSLAEPVVVDHDWKWQERYRPGQFCGYGRILCLPQGQVVELELGQGQDERLSLLAINGLDKYTPTSAWRPRVTTPAQILLSHETYLGRLKGFDRTHRRDDFGSRRLRDLIVAAGPQRHFFGHHHWYYPEVVIPNHQGGATLSVGLNQVGFENHRSRINPGCFGVLRAVGSAAERFEIVEDRWFVNLCYGGCTAWI
jgi:hypothetical protein